MRTEDKDGKQLVTGETRDLGIERTRQLSLHTVKRKTRIFLSSCVCQYGLPSKQNEWGSNLALSFAFVPPHFVRGEASLIVFQYLPVCSCRVLCSRLSLQLFEHFTGQSKGLISRRITVHCQEHNVYIWWALCVCISLSVNTIKNQYHLKTERNEKKREKRQRFSFCLCLDANTHDMWSLTINACVLSQV